MKYTFKKSFMSLLTLMAMLVNALGVMVAPAHAAAGVDLFNNLNASSPGTTQVEYSYDAEFGYSIYWEAQKFSTDATHTKITDVVLKLCNNGSATGLYNVEIWDTSGVGGGPGVKVADVAVNQNVSSLPVFSYPDCNPVYYTGLSISLSASTSYYLVARGAGDGSGLSGTLIVPITPASDGLHMYQYNGSMSTWNPDSYYAMQMEVVADIATVTPPTCSTQSYSHPKGSGDRSALITLGGTVTDAASLIDGGFSPFNASNDVAGNYYDFDFGSTVAMSELKWTYRNSWTNGGGSQPLGAYKVQASQDGSTYFDVSAIKDMGMSTGDTTVSSQTISIDAAYKDNGYRYYRLLITSTPNSTYPNEMEVEFSLCDTAAADTTAPTVDSFSATSPSSSLDVAITSFTASDATGVTGYMITESSSAPAAGDAGWSALAPTTYTVAGNGSYTLYPWAKDAAGNVSSAYGSPASVTVCVPSTITVTSTADSGAGTLRQGIADSCSGGTINFDSSLSGQIIRLASTLTLDKNLTIDGSSLASQVSISGDADGDGNGNVMVMSVNADVTATLNSLIVTKGVSSCSDIAGGILNNGNLTVINSSITENDARPCTWDGGGIRNQSGATLTVTNSSFINNRARSGAGIVSGGTLVVTNSSFTGNIADRGDGAVGAGGGISAGNSVTISGSTFANNTGINGGALSLNGTVSISNSTIANNTAKQAAGILVNSGTTLTLKNSTIANNTVSPAASDGVGLAVFASTLHYSNTIIANSTGGPECSYWGSVISTTVKNIVEDGSCSPAFSIDPKLDVLANNGGSTQTMALLSGSPAINAGDDATCATSPVNNVDQRGVTRPFASHCDIGAYEAETMPLTVTADDKTITYGESEPAFTFTSNPVITFDVNPVCSVSGAHTNAGSYTIACSGGSASGYEISYVGGTLTINKATPTLSVTNSPVVFDGQPHAAVVEASVLGAVSNVLMDGAASQTNPGTYAVTADFAPTDSTNYNSLNGASAGDFVISDDVTPPAVLSSVRASANNTNAASVDFTVTFSEPVTGVDSSDFALGVTGVSGASITNVSGADNTYTVTVNTGTGNGTIRLDVLDDDSIVDVASNPLDSAFNTGEEFSIIKSAPKPSIPVLVSPAAGALVNTLQPRLDWKDTTPLADHYHVRVATNSTFTALVINETNVLASDFTPASNLAPGKLYYWHVRALNVIDGTNGWSVVRTFKTPLDQPNLVSPTDTESLLTDRPSFDWDAVPGAASYVFQVSTSNTFSTLLVNTTVTDSEYTLTKDLPQNKNLYWRVRAKTSAVTGPWSAKWSFKTGNPASVPVLVSPASGVLVKDYTPLLNWNNSTVPTGTTFKHYELQLDDNGDFSSPEIETTTISSEFTPAANLASNTKFYWRVRAVNTVSGVDHVSGWSPVWSFRTVIAAPASLTMVPNVDNPLRPGFEWDDATAPITGYTIQISTSASFSTFIVNSTTVNSNYEMLKNLPAGKTIYWRVRVNGANGPSAWVTTQFTMP